MTRFNLALSDLAPAADPASVPARAPALEGLLARAELRSVQALSWRHWLLEQAGIVVPDAPLPLAAMALARREPLAFATPVHLVAGMDRVYLGTGGLLELEAAERAELAQGFEATFGGGRGLPFGFIALATDDEVVTHDPANLAGRDAGDWLPSGRGGAALRLLMTEIQMWLHDHPVNASRAARGLREVNSLWLWGTGSLEHWPKGRPRSRLCCSDPALLGWWRQAGGDIGSASPEATRLADAVSLSSLSADPNEAISLLDERVAAPLAAALAEGRYESVELFAAGRVFALTARQRWRLWRRSRPWWESLA